MTYSELKIHHGRWFVADARDNNRNIMFKVSGRLSVSQSIRNNRMYLCHNDPRLHGSWTNDSFGYSHGWVMTNVTIVDDQLVYYDINDEIIITHMRVMDRITLYDLL